MNNVRYNNQIMNSCIKQFKNDIEKDHTLLFNLFYSYMSNSIKCNACNNELFSGVKFFDNNSFMFLYCVFACIVFCIKIQFA